MSKIQKEIDKLKSLQDPKNINPVLLTVHQQVKRRIHDRGRAANNSRIGSYSDGYLKKRQKKGLGSNKKVILEFTGQMRRDFVPIKLGQYVVGSGFNNPENFKKARWVEETYGKVIYALTKKETNLLTSLLQKRADKILSS